MISDDKDLDAAERALHALSADNESKEGRLRRSDWEKRLAPLNDLLPEVNPPPHLFECIMSQIDADFFKSLRNAEKRAKIWKSVAITSILACVVVSAVLLNELRAPQPGAERYVSILTPTGSGDGLLIEVQSDGQIAKLHSFQIEARTAGSLQIWWIREGADPVPVGVLAKQGITVIPLQAKPGDTIAISREPAGGSPNLSPTGPIVYSGRLRGVE